MARDGKGNDFLFDNQENIGEVFDKCKMKILETAASLCGVLNSEELNAFTKTIDEQKREEFLKRFIAAEIQEESEMWTAVEVGEAKLRLLLQEFIDES